MRVDRIHRGLLFVGLVAALTGCRDDNQTLDELLDRAAELPGVRSSSHSALREEFRLVELSRGLPEHLNEDPVLAHQNAAVALEDALPQLETITRINEQTQAFLEAVPVADATFIHSESGALGAKWVNQTAAVDEATGLPDCDFEIRLEHGYFNDLTFVYRVAAGCRLLLVDSLYHFGSNDEVALARLAAAWKWTDWLAESHHVEARVQAAQLRSEALLVLEAFANRPGVTRDDLTTLHAILQESVNPWPSVKETLVRERALAIATYEGLRLHLCDLLFTLEERSQLRADGVYETLRQAEVEQVDADEAAYLEYMREIIAVADQPFHERSKHLVECDRLLRANEQTDDFPWFANHLFVLNNSLTLAQRELASDRGRIQGWLTLLSDALGVAPPTNNTNPVNGEKYQVQSRGSQRFVDLGDRRSANPRLTVPPLLGGR
ncbi:hypothetical protein NG895_25130 [Aeoliella sp. ICT_H6.2]|uniref:Uncharacterized protein n=1 Tax=Aeoliella straminimaris TaxID=2954799 RepID=A0A9X2FIJ2_9BACT|nr:hypothetical protein [Aeoliella straminimaris]MCO6047196.1 hypothetical protein [Aeoliella straminimaris]